MEQLKILIVEEDESKRLMFAMYLADQKLEQDAHFIRAEQLNQELLQSEIFDLLIIDLNNLEFGMSELIVKVRDYIETPLIITEQVVNLESYKDADLNNVHFVEDILDLENIHKFIKKLLRSYINIRYLTEIAEIAMPEPSLFIDRLAVTFYELAPQKINQIEELLFLGNLDAVSKTAHALRSTCYNVGAHSLGEVLKDLEETSRKGVVVNSEKFWPLKLRHEFLKAKNELQEIVAQKRYLKS